MPRVTRNEPQEKLIRLMKGYDCGHGAALARVLDCSVSTAIRKLNNPAALTIEDLNKLNRYAHIPADDIREAIGF